MKLLNFLCLPSVDRVQTASMEKESTRVLNQYLNKHSNIVLRDIRYLLMYI